MSRKFKINELTIDDHSESFVIAEIGHNHRGSIDDCMKLFKSAKDSGANAVKLQKRSNKNLYTKAMYNWIYTSENSYGKTYGEHREALEFNLDQYKELKNYAEELGLTFFATPFDFESVDFLEKLELPLYKISSSDLKNLELVKYIAEMQKPTILSTGGANMKEIRNTYDIINKVNKNLCIMQCVSSYPVDYSELNLNVISTFRKEFPDTVIGFSSHDSGVTSVLSAYHLGARVFEKHFTLNRAWKGTDHAFSLEPMGLKRIVRDLSRARISLGNGIKDRIKNEEKPMSKMEKIIVAHKKIEKGAILKKEILCVKIPSPDELDKDCFSPNQLNKLIGNRINTQLEKDEPIKKNVLENG